MILHIPFACLPPLTQLIKSLLEDLPWMFADDKNGHCALGPALLVAEKLLVRDELTRYTTTAFFE